MQEIKVVEDEMKVAITGVERGMCVGCVIHPATLWQIAQS